MKLNDEKRVPETLPQPHTFEFHDLSPTEVISEYENICIAFCKKLHLYTSGDGYRTPNCPEVEHFVKSVERLTNSSIREGVHHQNIFVSLEFHD